MNFILVVTLLTSVVFKAAAQSSLTLPKELLTSSDLKLGDNAKKLYVQLNKEYYLLGEHVWFNVFASDAFALDQGVVKLDLVAPSGEIVGQQFINIDVTSGNGAIHLDKEIGPGIYRIYASNEHMGIHRKLIQKFPVFANYVDDLPKNGGPKFPAKGTVSFFPEGGQLINNMTNKVLVSTKQQFAEKNELEGSIYNENNVKIADIELLENGLGYFEFVADTSRYYYSTDTIATSARFYLPPVKDAYGLAYSSAIKGYHSFEVFCAPNFKDITEKKEFVLIGVNDGQLVYKHGISFDGKGKSQAVIPFGDLPHGVVYFGLFDIHGNVLGQRAIFNEKYKSININAELNKSKYESGEVASLTIETLDHLNRPIPANLSIRVLNDKFTDQSSKKQQNILTSLYYRDEKTDVAVVDKSGLNDKLIANSLNLNEWRLLFSDQETNNDGVGKIEQIINRIKYLKENEMQSMARISIFFVEAHVIEEFYFDELEELRTVLRDVLGKNHLFIYAFDWKGDRIGQIKFNGNLQGADKVYPTLKEGLTYQKSVEDYIAFKKKKNLVDLVYNLHNPSTSINKDVIQFEWAKPDYFTELADFNTLPSMKETIRGVVAKTHVKKEKGRDRIYLSPKISSFKYNDSPLILINNIPTYNDSIVLALDAKDIAEIGVRNSIRTQSDFGTFGSKGVLSIKLKKGVENPLADQFNLLPVMEGINPAVRYDAYRPRSSDDKIPDFRSMPYWHSSITTNEQGKAIIEFDNCDLVADYVIYIEGMSEKHEPGAKTLRYKVASE